MPTMDDIAKKLGVAKSTVSKALNGAPDVSESMRRTVVETAVELGYTRVMHAEKKKRIAVFIEHIDYQNPDDFGSSMIDGFRKMAEPAGYSVTVVPLSKQLEKSERYDEYMLRNDYAGGFFLGMTADEQWMSEFKTCRTPTVLFDNRVKNNPFVTSIGVDNEEGLEIAVSCLKSLGHKKIGYLSAALGSYVYQQRYLSFFHALRKYGLDDSRSLGGHAYYTTQCLDIHLPRLLKNGCTAIICSHDLLAHALIIHCKEQNIRIPGDLSVIGFDDIPLCQYTTPTLSSVRQDRNELGRSAFYALQSQLNQIPISTLYLHATLIQRDSIGPCPQTSSI